MNLSRAFRMAAALGGVGLMLGSSITTAQATTTYHGRLTYGAVHVHTNCSGDPAAPTSITVSVPYDATHWNLSAPISVVAYYNPADEYDPNPGLRTTSPSMIHAGQAGTLSGTMPIPAGAQSLPVDNAGVGVPGAEIIGPRTAFVPSCSAPDNTIVPAPVVQAISNPCLGITTATIANPNAFAVNVYADPTSPLKDLGQSDLPAHATTVFNVGSALRGAEHFALRYGGGANPEVPLIYSVACKPGHPVTTFSAVHRYSRDVLTATARTGLVPGDATGPGGVPVMIHLPLVGAPVTFYRLYAGKRVFVGSGTTGPHGISVLSVPHRPNTYYLAVIGVTHYSLRTATVTRFVR